MVMLMLLMQQQIEAVVGCCARMPKILFSYPLCLVSAASVGPRGPQDLWNGLTLLAEARAADALSVLKLILSGDSHLDLLGLLRLLRRLTASLSTAATTSAEASLVEI